MNVDDGNMGVNVVWEKDILELVWHEHFMYIQFNSFFLFIEATRVLLTGFNLAMYKMLWRQCRPHPLGLCERTA